MARSKIIKINPEKPELKKIKIAADAIRCGGIVAFPTETVYGLGGDVFNQNAIYKIFRVKNRPSNDPLIVHIASVKDLFRITKKVPETALKLAEKFWPGPLTLVLKKSHLIPDIVTAGLDTVAVRMPKNKIALNLIKYSRTPIAAPSANIFGKPSPTCAQHVIDDLAGKIDIIIDGGRTLIGVESTVIDITKKPFKILRPGGISREEINDLLGQTELTLHGKKILRSPGMLKHHYSPDAKLILVEKKENQIEKMKKLTVKYKKQNKIVGIITTEKNYNKFDNKKFKVAVISTDISKSPTNLFAILREFDKKGVDIIIAEGIKSEGVGLAIMDRLRKAASKII